MAQSPRPHRRTRRTIGSPPIRYLSAALRDGDLRAITAVNPDWLTEDEAETYRVVVDYHSSYDVLPTPQAMQERGQPLPEVTEPLDAYRDTMFNQMRIQGVAEVITELQPLLEANNGVGAADLLMAWRNEYQDPGSQTNPLADRLEAMRDRWQAGMRSMGDTGIASVDAAVGGVAKGSLWALAGRPGSGKTYLQLAGCSGMLYEGRRILYITKELSREEMEDRLFVMLTDADPSLKVRRPVSTEGSRRLTERWDQAVGLELAQNIIITDDPMVRTPTDIAALMAETRCNEVLIDGTYYLIPTNYHIRMSRTEAYEALIRELRALALHRGVTIGITWQRNRTGGQGTEGLYGTDALSQDASLVLTIKKYRGNNVLRGLYVAKNRHGPEEFEIGTAYSFKPTTIGEPCELPERAENTEAATGRDRHVARAVRNSGAPGAGE